MGDWKNINESTIREVPQTVWRDQGNRTATRDKHLAPVTESLHHEADKYRDTIVGTFSLVRQSLP